MFRLGAISPERLAGYKSSGMVPPSLHSPLFYPDAKDALITGVTALGAAALELLKTDP
jgi:hippurate hydrolase